MKIMEYKCTIKKGEILFRYDLSEPPVNWSPDYKSIEYSSKNKGGGCKNMANNFFFYSNEVVTKNTAVVAMSKLAEKEYWLTSTKTSRNLNLLCLCGRDTFCNLLKLHESGINIFTDDFSFYFGKEEKLSILKEPFEEWHKCDVFDIERKIELRNRLIQPFENSNCPFGLLGQVLTDYENGIAFTKLLTERGYDGYVFDESVGGHTICLINKVVIGSPTALSKPLRVKIDL